MIDRLLCGEYRLQILMNVGEGATQYFLRGLLPCGEQRVTSFGEKLHGILLGYDCGFQVSGKQLILRLGHGSGG
jgi:hypothetical protein